MQRLKSDESWSANGGRLLSRFEAPVLPVIQDGCEVQLNEPASMIPMLSNEWTVGMKKVARTSHRALLHSGPPSEILLSSNESEWKKGREDREGSTATTTTTTKRVERERKETKRKRRERVSEGGRREEEEKKSGGEDGWMGTTSPRKTARERENRVGNGFGYFGNQDRLILHFLPVFNTLAYAGWLVSLAGALQSMHIFVYLPVCNYVLLSLHDAQATSPDWEKLVRIFDWLVVRGLPLRYW